MMPRYVYQPEMAFAQFYNDFSRPRPVKRSNDPFRQMAEGFKNSVEDMFRIGDDIEDSIDYTMRGGERRHRRGQRRRRETRHRGEDRNAYYEIDDMSGDDSVIYQDDQRRRNETGHRGKDRNAYYEIDDLSDDDSVNHQAGQRRDGGKCT